MLPTSSKPRPSSSSSSSSRPNSTWLPYLRRIIKWQQMDIEYTFWQMLHLCTSPKVVMIPHFTEKVVPLHTPFVIAISILNITNKSDEHFSSTNMDLIKLFRPETKNQWARDDPAFVVICSLLLTVATLAYCAAYDHSTAHAFFVVFSVLFFHFLLAGVFLATFCWYLTNAYLREEAPNSYVVEQRVEWMYAFDVHCNSFFPMFVFLYVIHYFVSPLLVAHGFIPELLSNLLFMVGASYYHYLNFLGYDVLPFLERTTFFLYPIGVVIVLSPILILSGFNPSRYFMNMYFSQQI